MDEKIVGHMDIEYGFSQTGIEKENLTFIGNSNSMRTVFDSIKRVADSDTTVIIYGESGTGKDLVAKTIHVNSNRRSCPFVPIACAEISDILMESELFGHEKGAFTGALNTRVGLFELAHNGTILFEEVGDMGSVLQSKLLRVIHERQFRRLGSNNFIKFTARIICTTNQNLLEKVRENRFREDLLHRINVVSINLPPLRNRKSDLPFLIDYFLKKHSNENRKDIRGIAKQAYDQLLNYDYPGNVLELSNILERAVVMSRGTLITVDDLPLREKVSNATGGDTERQLNLKDAIEEIEKQMIMKALQIASNNRTKAAKALGISERMVRYKMEKLGLK